jgi:hypothetical protein
MERNRSTMQKTKCLEDYSRWLVRYWHPASNSTTRVLRQRILEIRMGLSDARIPACVTRAIGLTLLEDSNALDANWWGRRYRQYGRRKRL